MLIAVAVIVGITFVGFGYAWMRRWDRRHEPADLGTVSHRWVAERRLGPGDQ